MLFRRAAAQKVSHSLLQYNKQVFVSRVYFLTFSELVEITD